MSKITFNTKYMYSEHGQRFAAESRDGVVMFFDVDRGIRGQFKSNEPLTEELVMFHYDYYNYEHLCAGDAPDWFWDHEWREEISCAK